MTKEIMPPTKPKGKPTFALRPSGSSVKIKTETSTQTYAFG